VLGQADGAAGGADRAGSARAFQYYMKYNIVKWGKLKPPVSGIARDHFSSAIVLGYQYVLK
jgi:hypothetical protein